MENETKRGVTVVCYGSGRYWEDRDAAKKFYRDGFLSCEGHESMRYLKIYSDIISGKAVATDEIERVV